MTIFINMKSRLTFFLSFSLPLFLLAQEQDNVTWDTIFVIDGDTTQFTIKGAPDYINALRSKYQKQLVSTYDNNQTAADFDAFDMNNQQQSLLRYRGQVVVLYFWGLYDQLSQIFTEQLNLLHQNYFDKEMVVLGLCNEDKTMIEKFYPQLSISFPIIPDSKHFGNQYYEGEQGSPRVFVIDKKGVIQYRLIGKDNEDINASLQQLQTVIKKLL